jgi:hypothetical protein
LNQIQPYLDQAQKAVQPYVDQAQPYLNQLKPYVDQVKPYYTQLVNQVEPLWTSAKNQATPFVNKAVNEFNVQMKYYGLNEQEALIGAGLVFSVFIMGFIMGRVTAPTKVVKVERK